MLRLFKNNYKKSEDQGASKNLDKNFGLSETRFQEMAALMQSSNNILLHHIYHVHFEICRDYLKERFFIDDSTAYDLFMDALVVFRTKVLNKKISYGNLKFLYTRLAINQYMDYHRNKKRLRIASKRFLEEIGNHSNISEERLSKVLTSSIEKLKKKDALLLHQLFLDEFPQEALAVEMGISYATLRKRKERALDRLKILITEAINQD